MKRCQVLIRVTDDMSSKVVVSVDGVVSLSSVLVHDHSSEVVGEQLVVGPQVESEVPANTNTPVVCWTRADPSEPVKNWTLTSAGRRSSAASPHGFEFGRRGGGRSASAAWREAARRSRPASSGETLRKHVH